VPKPVAAAVNPHSTDYVPIAHENTLRGPYLSASWPPTNAKME
jgi:hypothetical protein